MDKTKICGYVWYYAPQKYEESRCTCKRDVGHEGNHMDGDDWEMQCASDECSSAFSVPGPNSVEDEILKVVGTEAAPAGDMITITPDIIVPRAVFDRIRQIAEADVEERRILEEAARRRKITVEEKYGEGASWILKPATPYPPSYPSYNRDEYRNYNNYSNNNGSCLDGYYWDNEDGYYRKL